MRRTPIALMIVLALLAIGTTTLSACSADPTAEDGALTPDQALLSFGLTTDTSKTTIDLDRVLSGGPEKDAIPALTNPNFVSVEDAEVPNDEVRGIFLDMGGEQRFYPYNIMVWHEIANEEIGGAHVAVTF